MLKIITMKTLLLLICISFFLKVNCFPQTIAVGNYAEEIARMDQITGQSDNPFSFTIRPVSAGWENNKIDSALQGLTFGKKASPTIKLFGIPSMVQILPLHWLNEYNLNKPFGYNNGDLYPNAGYQSSISGGIFIKTGILVIQLNPELVYAENKPFNTFAEVQANNNSSQLLSAYFNTVNGIDAPERFGNKSLSHLYPGQSKISINLKNMELGISTENLWWGPGIQNAIMMSNSAPGFLHWTFNSVRPIKTKIGSFEWQIIGGILKESGFLPLDTGKLVYGKGLYIPKPQLNRYISALTVNWQPKWIGGLYLGFSEYDYMNMDAIYNAKNIVRRIIPVITGSSNNANSVAAGGDGQDFAFSLNVRQVLPKYNAEIYFEWARNDRWANLSDFLQEPEQASAYTFGGRRLFEIRSNQFIQVKMEVTHLQLPPNYLLRDEGSWYVHSDSPRDGYTNDGRYTGAGIGPGSNSFMFDISYVKENNSYGIAFERLVHNNDLYYSAFSGTGNFYTHWVDLSNTFYANYRIKKYLVSADLTPVYSLNYEYKSGSSFNLHTRINLTYFFN
ncbi:MAG: hypothetical protein JWR54_2132 [Mucilaginibacter sp.]|nr:hypothetical protein [Mucilaginibacter sp.]